MDKKAIAFFEYFSPFVCLMISTTVSFILLFILVHPVRSKIPPKCMKNKEKNTFGKKNGKKKSLIKKMAIH